MTSPSLCTCREQSVNLVRKASGPSCSSLRPDSACKWVFCQSLSEFPLDFSGLWHQIATLTWRNSLERTFFLIQIKTCTFRFCLFLSPQYHSIPLHVDGSTTVVTWWSGIWTIKSDLFWKNGWQSLFYSEHFLSQLSIKSISCTSICSAASCCPSSGVLMAPSWLGLSSFYWLATRASKVLWAMGPGWVEDWEGYSLVPHLLKLAARSVSKV